MTDMIVYSSRVAMRVDAVVARPLTPPLWMLCIIAGLNNQHLNI